ncbi:hypothetical protein [Blastococcus saxobsidens]|uniref:Uncharacterized protein n=1 Tax=Blastococcus saxobsidens (strain DD2) TaxID=1146883 RepID=H6RM70_BLASD|nr:hypothetical protein [Blastococcus saxobsidens]CCG01312.1 protein of unknown function [Blastococcus saxobsidens DD2]
MSVTVVLRGPEAAGYGRHAAPLSAYGPSDVHRVLPVSPTGSRVPEQTDSGDALVEVIDSAGRAEVAVAGGVVAGARSSGEVSMKTTGFWARLRLLPKAA